MHAIYGHANGICANPALGQRTEDGCSDQRENVIREELGLRRRTDCGLDGLLLARR